MRSIVGFHTFRIQSWLECSAALFEAALSKTPQFAISFFSDFEDSGSTVAKSSTPEIPHERRLSGGSFASETHSAEVAQGFSVCLVVMQFGYEESILIHLTTEQSVEFFDSS